MGLKEKLKTERAKAELTQEQLAERLDISRQHVSKWETGASEPSLKLFRRLIVALNCSPADLIQ